MNKIYEIILQLGMRGGGINLPKKDKIRELAKEIQKVVVKSTFLIVWMCLLLIV